MNKARGMPSMALSPNAQARLDKEKEEVKEDPFKRPNLEIKEINEEPKSVQINESANEVKTIEEPAPTPVKKPKKKLTEKQLEALKRGRQKSIETRKKKAEEAKKLKEQKSVAPKNHIESTYVPPPSGHTPYQPPPQHIDYDRIINGVANIYQQHQQKQAQQSYEEEVEFNVNEFEKKVREEERNKVYAELEKIQKEEEQQKAQATAQKYLNRQPQSVNPYAYAFQMGSRNRFKRY